MGEVFSDSQMDFFLNGDPYLCYHKIKYPNT